jgi:hypothetical protein
MTGYSISLGEVEALCHRMNTEVETIGEHACELRRSEVGPSDFGSGQRVGELYATVTQGLLADSLHGAGTVSAHLTDLLTGTFRAYQQVDEDSRDHFRI